MWHLTRARARPARAQNMQYCSLTLHRSSSSSTSVRSTTSSSGSSNRSRSRSRSSGDYSMAKIVDALKSSSSTDHIPSRVQATPGSQSAVVVVCIRHEMRSSSSCHDVFAPNTCTFMFASRWRLCIMKHFDTFQRAVTRGQSKERPNYGTLLLTLYSGT